jgi:hypothetical protein
VPVLAGREGWGGAKIIGQQKTEKSLVFFLEFSWHKICEKIINLLFGKL